MKKHHLTLLTVIVLLWSCEKIPTAPAAEVPIESKNARKYVSKDLRISAFRHRDFYNPARLYTFHYRNTGLIDSVVVTGDINYTYRVFYNGSRIDSVNLVRDGKIASAINNIRYEGNLVRHIDRWSMRDQGQPYPFPWEIVYDSRKRIVSPFSYCTFHYNDDDIIFSKVTSNYPRGTSFFAFEYTPNPLFIKDLLVVFIEEPGVIQYSFHKWNVKTETFNNGDKIDFVNEFDEFGRLTRMTGTDNYGVRDIYEFYY